MTKYSILIPVYNVEKYLKECLDSVVNQDFPKNEYEIIITDDGSTDGSSSICDEYQDKYDNVHVIHQENQGLMMARRTGIMNAKGQYLLFIDSDDYVDADMLNIVDEVVNKEMPDFLMHSYLNTYKNTEKPCRITGNDKEVLSKKDFLLKFAASSNFNSIVCKVVKKEILTEHIDEIYRGVNIAEDMLQTAYLTKYSDKIVLLNAVPYHYRIQGGSMIHQATFDKIEKTLEVYKAVISVIDDIINNEKNWTESVKKEICSLFDANVLNGLMDNLFRYNNSFDKPEIGRLQELSKSSLVQNTEKKYIDQILPVYNKVRLQALKNKKYRVLLLIDKILMKVQIVKEKIEGAEWY